MFIHIDFQFVNGGICSNNAARRWTSRVNDVGVEQCYGFHFAGPAPEAGPRLVLASLKPLSDTVQVEV